MDKKSLMAFCLIMAALLFVITFIIGFSVGLGSDSQLELSPQLPS